MRFRIVDRKNKVCYNKYKLLKIHQIKRCCVCQLTKKTRSFFTSKSVVHQWTLSFIIVLIVPIILNFIAYSLSIHSIEKETTKTNLSFYENTQRQIDTTLLSYRKVAEVLSSMAEIQKNMDPDDPQVFDAIKTTLLLYDVDLKDVYLNFLYYKSYDTVATCSP